MQNPTKWANSFRSVPLSPERSLLKPRLTGLTMLVDMGIGTRQLEDLLHTSGNFVDIGKIATGSAALYDSRILAEKLEIYRRHNVSTFIGGQCLEYVIFTSGWSAVESFLSECATLGVDGIEVSDNLVPLNLDEKRHLISLGIGIGLEVHGEVGSKRERGDPSALVSEALALLGAGCADVLVEAAELVDDKGHVLADVVATLESSLPLDRILIELPGHWIRGVGPNEVYRMMTFLVSTFGPNVNIGNVWWDQVLILEAIRHGLAASGPLAIQAQETKD